MVVVLAPVVWVSGHSPQSYVIVDRGKGLGMDSIRRPNTEFPVIL
jgi:hypothetical protein